MDACDARESSSFGQEFLILPTIVERSFSSLRSVVDGSESDQTGLRFGTGLTFGRLPLSTTTAGEGTHHTAIVSSTTEGIAV
jgi:hypothetical protein